MEGFFYCSIEKNSKNTAVLNKVEKFAKDNMTQVFCIKEPLGSKKYKYDYNESFAVCIPKYKIIIINCDEEKNECFDEYFDDLVEDLGSISDRYDYRKVLGRPKHWKDNCVVSVKATDLLQPNYNFNENLCKTPDAVRKAELLISLLTGSINDIDRVGDELPHDILEAIKKKIILFDTTQTDFIYNNQAKKTIRIQGLAGTGKTELLLYKLKELYTQEDKPVIAFTCFNKVLATDIKNRIPSFFNFMKVDEQILWNERLFVMSSWGSSGNVNSGIYRFICGMYNIPFSPYGGNSFDTLCIQALEAINKLDSFEYCFDYVLIDESQDFSEDFFVLCEKVTRHKVYIAGDIFQDIFANAINDKISPDYLLNKCYRTDPKTLMFAHALGLGLMEKPQLRWLDDDGWKACGYNFEKKMNQYLFSRDPIRRFEDINDQNIESIKLLIETEDAFVEEVIHIMTDLKMKYMSLKPSDIGIVFLEDVNSNYKMMDILQFKIQETFGWLVAKGYETKKKEEDSVYVSNINNIKGLEFPFIICISTLPLNNYLRKRNSLYMLLTRSFITSYLLMTDRNNSNNISNYQKTINEIFSTGKMTIAEPSQKEKEEMEKFIFSVKQANKSLESMINDELVKRDITKNKEKKTIVDMTLKILQEKDLYNENIDMLIADVIENIVAAFNVGKK